MTTELNRIMMLAGLTPRDDAATLNVATAKVPLREAMPLREVVRPFSLLRELDDRNAPKKKVSRRVS